MDTPQDWQWSSYRATIAEEKEPSFLSVEWILSQFSDGKTEVVERYKRFVMEGIGKGYPVEQVKGKIILGSEKFIEMISKHLKGKKEELKEIPRIQRYVTRPELCQIFKNEQNKDKSKDFAIYKPYREYGYTMKEIGEYLGVHYSIISRAIKRIEKGN